MELPNLGLVLAFMKHLQNVTENNMSDTARAQWDSHTAAEKETEYSLQNEARIKGSI